MITTSDVMTGKAIVQLGLSPAPVVRQTLRDADHDPSPEHGDLINRLVAGGHLDPRHVETLRHRIALYAHVRGEAVYLRMLERRTKVPKEIVAQLISGLERQTYRRRLGDVLVQQQKLSKAQDQVLVRDQVEWVKKEDEKILARYRGQDFEGVERALIPNSALAPEDFKISRLFRSQETRALVERADLAAWRRELEGGLAIAPAKPGDPETRPLGGESTHVLGPRGAQLPGGPPNTQTKPLRTQPQPRGSGTPATIEAIKAKGQIGPYRITELLGAGGMGAVFLAQQDGDSEYVAVKVLLEGQAPGIERGRFQREIELLERIQHPHVIRLLGSGQADGVRYLVVPALVGRELRGLMNEFPQGQPTEIWVPIARQLLMGLQAVHDAEVVHRDMKPANVFVLAGAEPEVRIMDFGLAKKKSGAIDETNCSLTATGEIVGSPAYMAPECVSNDPIDGRTDLYSFGVLLFELLTGRLPIEAESAQSFLTAHLVRPPLTLAEANPHGKWPPALELLLEDLLGKTREERPATATEALARLDALVGDLEASRVDREIRRAEPGTPGGWGFRGLLGRLRGRAR
ncbi:MAG: serine/threonine-protein kinase [Planctomycetota bacterium]